MLYKEHKNSSDQDCLVYRIQYGVNEKSPIGETCKISAEKIEEHWRDIGMGSTVGSTEDKCLNYYDDLEAHDRGTTFHSSCDS